eukprot:TRINITY_DN115826_c0_g1_i1.p1 TRINITY_DN115826_c0_g1~~TRINITY_DN115826_c0_g1_i1.p1  ORF type:complete len:116 (-),score=20.47 TRINITY_DN115826_c0_g1_i1:311-658(-)
MPTHAEVIAQNPLEAPAPFWDNVYYACNGFAAFLLVASVVGGFVYCCVGLIIRVERWEDERAARKEAAAGGGAEQHRPDAGSADAARSRHASTPDANGDAAGLRERSSAQQAEGK